MSSGLFSFTSFDFDGIQSTHIVNDYEKEEVGINGKQVDNIFGIEELEEFDPFCSEYGVVYKENIAKKALHLFEDQPQELYQLEAKSHCLSSDDFSFSSFSPPPPQSFQENIQTRNNSELFQRPNINEALNSINLSSLELLSNYGSGFRKLKAEQLSDSKPPNETSSGREKLSIEEIMRVAAARYIQFSDLRYDDFSMVMHPFGYALRGLSEEETKDVELVHLLLAVAEKVAYHQLERASRLLSRCEWIASERGNPVQRIVFYFGEALRERIDKETGSTIITPNNVDQVIKGRSNITEAYHGLSTNITFAKLHQRLPFLQVMQFMGIQAVVECVSSASTVHLIDLEIRSGVQWTVLMQAIAETWPIELLKITAVGITGKEKIEDTGKRLKTMAESVNLPFCFKAVYISDMIDINEELFEIEDGECVVIYCPLILRTMICRPNCLENLMRVIKNLNPSIVVVIEVEANHNSPSFVNRFVEALFFYSAFLDCLETCMDYNVELRMMTELIFNNGIRQIVAMEGNNRIARSVKIDVWRAFFTRFGLVEIGFSESNLYQANLVIKQFPCASCCTVVKNGKTVIVGWKGTPIHSLSVWKFSKQISRRPLLNYRFSNIHPT